MASTRPSLPELFGAFFRVGLTSFGMAILQNLKQMSLRRGFVSEAEIEEGLALLQLYPGPMMVDLVAYIGYRRRGPWGALAATAGMLTPATLLMLVLSALYQRFGALPAPVAMLPGLGALVVGVVLNVTFDFAQKNLKNHADALLALFAFSVGALGGNMVWAVGIGIAAGALMSRHEHDDTIEKSTARLPWRRLAVPLLMGSLLLEVEHQWLDPAQSSAAIALGQITPGPILNSATFVGWQVAGLAGALASTFAIFAPSVVMTMVFTELFTHVRHLAAVRGAIRGVMCFRSRWLGCWPAQRWWRCAT